MSLVRGGKKGEGDRKREGGGGGRKREGERERGRRVLICFYLQLIPPEINFDAQSNPPAFVSEDETIRISKDDEVRLKVVGTRVDATEIVCLHTTHSYIPLALPSSPLLPSSPPLLFRMLIFHSVLNWIDQRRLPWPYQLNSMLVILVFIKTKETK